MILCDAAPLFCSVDKSQPRHQDVKIFIENESSCLITTWACFTESMYLCRKSSFTAISPGKMNF